ncbi:HNH endonuclease signature motif containing protein [Mycolicibacterium setense]|uniref:HNH endonuclease signature motif containing protein n=3 Tax=Mycolicibacterium setense TaxID=431269 RepID=UPI000C7B290A|nr:HNH endonuclease signature motif containing protein [Mycolicibacterium setense]
MYVRIMEAGAVEAVAGLRAAFDGFAACDFGALTRAQVLAVLDEYETLTCQLPGPLHRLLAQLQAEATPRELGAKSWNAVLRIRWRLSSAEAGRRLAEAAELGPRRAVTGEPLAPVLPVVAAAQAAGLLTGDHVKVLRDAVGDLPGFVDQTTRDQFEADLVRVAVGVGPKELKETAELRLFLLDQDGPEPDDIERARKRGVTVSKQGRDAMTALTANMTPEAAAVFEVLFAKFAAPGMCNPDDDEPCTCGTPSQAQIDNDHRGLAQRQHDALLVIGRIVLMSGDLGQLNGLPVSVIIRTTLQDLESRAGIGVSGGGTKLPIKDVIRMGAHANHHLAVFDEATGAAVNYFRARRIASPAQRIMLIARDGGCTKPCCTVGAYGCQVHHAAADWADGGNTNVDEMTLACGPDNRMVHTDGGYTTTINARGEVEWHPPAGLDHGQSRINYHHRPELLLTPPDPNPTSTPTPEVDPQPGTTATPEPEPQWEPIPDLTQHHDPEPASDPVWELEPDLAPTPQRDPDPDWDLAPDHVPQPHWDECDLESDQWDLERDRNFDQPAPIPPHEQYLWDTESFDPAIPPGWELLHGTPPHDPDPWQPIDNHAVTGKAIRGP